MITLILPGWRGDASRVSWRTGTLNSLLYSMECFYLRFTDWTWIRLAENCPWAISLHTNHLRVLFFPSFNQIKRHSFNSNFFCRECERILLRFKNINNYKWIKYISKSQNCIAKVAFKTKGVLGRRGREKKIKRAYGDGRRCDCGWYIYISIYTNDVL